MRKQALENMMLRLKVKQMHLNEKSLLQTILE